MHGYSSNQAAVFQGISKIEEPTLIMVKVMSINHFSPEIGEKNGLKLTQEEDINNITHIFEVNLPDRSTLCSNWDLFSKKEKSFLSFEE
jgi:hypothetical protein